MHRKISLCMLALPALFLLLIGWGCNSEPTTSPRSPDGGDKVAGGPTIGELHNGILAEIDMRRSFFTAPKCSNCKEFNELFVASANEAFTKAAISQTVTEEDVQYYRAEFDQLRQLGLLDVFAREVLDADALCDHLVQIGALNQVGADWMEGFLLEMATSPDPATLQARIILYCAEHGMPEPGSLLALFLDVFSSSNEFWGQPKKLDWWKIGHYASDAVGAIIGGLGGTGAGGAAGGIVGGAIGAGAGSALFAAEFEEPG